MRTCIICDIEYDPNSQAKRLAGGLITHCPDCSEETEVKALGLSNGDGKQASVTIVKLDSNEDRAAFMTYWKKATGYHKGKECQMDSKITSPKIKFKTVVQSEATNHKGKL